MLYNGEATLARRFYFFLGPWATVVMLTFAAAAAVFTLKGRKKPLLVTGLTLVLLVFGGFGIAKAVFSHARAELQQEEPAQCDVRAEFSWGWIILMASACVITVAAVSMKSPNETLVATGGPAPQG